VESGDEPVRRSLAEIRSELEGLAAELDRINRKQRRKQERDADQRTEESV
jgi:hypothetical protein